MDLHEKEKMYQRLIVFTLLIGMVIYYFEKNHWLFGMDLNYVFTISTRCWTCLCV